MTFESEEPSVIQQAAQDVRTTARKAYFLEVVLIGVAALAVAVAAVLSAWNTVRLREVAEDARVLAEAARVQSEFNEQLSKLVADYNTAHAESSAQGHAALAEALACSLKLFLTFPETTAAGIDACNRPIQPPPPPPIVPPSPNHKDPGKTEKR